MRSIAGFLSVLIFAIGSYAAVTVDFSKDEGPILHSGNGFLWGISTAAPNDTLISRLKPKMLRAGAQTGSRCAFEIYDRAKALGVQEIQAIVCEAVGFRQPGTANLSWDSYLSTVTNLVNRAKTENKDFVWDIWNEPDYGQFWSGTWDQWLETWKRTYQAIKAADPNAVITGPSTCECSGSYGDIITVTKFIDYAAANNCMPQIVCWHMNESGYWIDNRHIESDAHRVRLQLARLGYDTTKILLSSNEYGDGGYATNSGGCVEYFAQMERARFTTGAKACWGTCNGQSLCGIVNGSSPNQVWWTYRRYAEMNGRKFNVTFTDKTDGVAAFDSAAHILNILVGSHLGSTATTSTSDIKVINYGNLSGTVQAKIERMAAPPQVVSTSNLAITPAGFTISLPKLSASNAYFISISNFMYGGSTAAHQPLIVNESIDRGIQLLPHAKVVVPSAAYSLRVANAAGATILRKAGMGPKTCDLSAVGNGMHVMYVTSRGITVSRTFVNVK